MTSSSEESECFVEIFFALFPVILTSKFDTLAEEVAHESCRCSDALFLTSNVVLKTPPKINA
jgi:hypothetical protein